MTNTTERNRQHRFQRFIVGVTKTHAIKRFGQPPRQLGADLEIGIGGERRHDFARIALSLVHGDLARHASLLRVLFDSGEDVRIIQQPVGQHLTLGEFERLDVQLEAGIQLVDGAVGAVAQRPADRRDQQPVEQGDDGKQREERNRPDRQRDLARHWRPRVLPQKRSAGDLWMPHCGA